MRRGAALLNLGKRFLDRRGELTAEQGFFQDAHAERRRSGTELVAGLGGDQDRRKDDPAASEDSQSLDARDPRKPLVDHKAGGLQGRGAAQERLAAVAKLDTEALKLEGEG